MDDAAPPQTNRPQLDLYAVLSPDVLDPWLDDKFAPCAVRHAVLMDANKRFLTKTADGIKTSEDAGRTADFVVQLKKHIKEVEAVRVAIKEPVLAAERQIDGKGKELTAPTVAAIKEAERRGDVYLKAKDAEIRRLAAEEAARKDAEAQLLIDQAVETGDQTFVEQAEEAATEAVIALETATAKPSDLVQLRGPQFGGTARLRDDWKFEVVNIREVPEPLLFVDDKAAMAIVHAQLKQKQTPHIPGLRIYNEPKAAFR